MSAKIVLAIAAVVQTGHWRWINTSDQDKDHEFYRPYIVYSTSVLSEALGEFAVRRNPPQVISAIDPKKIPEIDIGKSASYIPSFETVVTVAKLHLVNLGTFVNDGEEFALHLVGCDGLALMSRTGRRLDQPYVFAYDVEPDVITAQIYKRAATLGHSLD